MGCSRCSIASDYHKLSVIPQSEHEWRALLVEWVAIFSETMALSERLMGQSAVSERDHCNRTKQVSLANRRDHFCS
jgi:hypothetical protein